MERLSKRFPSVFDETRPFDESSIQVDFTSRVRSRDTAYAFLSQWFTRGVFNQLIEPRIQGNVNDKLLQFHRDCQNFLKVSQTLKNVSISISESRLLTSTENNHNNNNLSASVRNSPNVLRIFIHSFEFISA